MVFYWKVRKSNILLHFMHFRDSTCNFKLFIIIFDLDEHYFFFFFFWILHIHSKYTALTSSVNFYVLVYILCTPIKHTYQSTDFISRILIYTFIYLFFWIKFPSFNARKIRQYVYTHTMSPVRVIIDVVPPMVSHVPFAIFFLSFTLRSE